MGKRGPRPTPTAIKARRGSERAMSNPHEPKPERCKPAAPRHMSAAAKKNWKPLVELLDAAGILTRADLTIVERYCETLVLWRQCREHLSEHGQVYEVKKWDAEQKEFATVGWRHFPQAKLISAHETALLQHERELGLTPSARTRLVSQERDPGRPPGDENDRNAQPTFKGPVLRGGKAG